jgi:hypothetical protein
MSNKTEIFGRIEGIVLVKLENRHYQVLNTKSDSQTSDKMVLKCFDGGSIKMEIQVSSKDFLESLQGMLDSEQETECKQLLILDLDAHEWLCYPINEKLMEKFPFLKRDTVDYIR